MIIDTNIINVLKGKNKAESFLQSSLDRDLLLSVITISEIHSGLGDDKEEQLFEELVTIFEVIRVPKP